MLTIYPQECKAMIEEAGALFPVGRHFYPQPAPRSTLSNDGITL
jgi:hypothetical protein